MKRDLHYMNIVMSILYFCAGILSICTCVVVDVFVFLLIGVCFLGVGISYFYIFNLERLEYQEFLRINKCRQSSQNKLENTQVFKKRECKK